MNRFTERLQLDPAEIAGLLSRCLLPEFYAGASKGVNKTVRKWNAVLLGIEVTVLEINTNRFKGMLDLQYVLEAPEWEFSFYLCSKEMTTVTNTFSIHVRVGKEEVHIGLPKFEGDFEAYRRDMSMIRLMDLKAEQEQAIMFPPPVIAPSPPRF